MHGSVVIIEEERTHQPPLDQDGCWEDHHKHHGSQEKIWDPLTGAEVNRALARTLTLTLTLALALALALALILTP